MAVVGGSFAKTAILSSRFAFWQDREETHPQRTIEIVSLGSGLGSTKFCAVWERVGWFPSAWLSCMGTFQTLRVWVCPYLLAPWYHRYLFHGNSQVCVSALLSVPSCSLSLRFFRPFGLFHLLFFDGHSYGHCCSGLHFLGRVLGPGDYPISLDLFCLAVESMENHQG